MDAARERIDASLSPLMEGLAQVRATLYTEANELRKSLAKGKVAGVTAKRIRKVADWFSTMNFSDDVELDTLLVALKGLAGDVQAGSRRAAEAIRTTPDEISKLCSKAATDAMSSGRFESLEI